MDQSQNEVLLTNTLSLIWENFLIASEEHDVKQHWLELFLFYFEFIDEETRQTPKFKSFFNPIPEEICSYLLERVYEIISKSEYYNPTQLGIETSLLDNDITGDVSKRPKRNHNFAQLILQSPNDCSKIVALRTFLTHHFGYHVLEFLLKVDIKLIASQKNLCNLCINLFPNCPWATNNDVELPKASTIFEYIGHLQLYQKPKVTRTLNSHSVSSSNGQQHSPTKTDKTELTDNLEKDIEEFKVVTKTSDELAYVLVELLIKCVGGESNALLTDQSMSTISLNFALDSLRVPHDTFGGQANAEIIKCKFLALIECCLNNLFANKANINAIQLQYTIARLVAALESNKVHEDPAEQTLNSALVKHVNDQILFGLNFIVFGILNNVVAIYGNDGASSSNTYNSRVNLYTLKFIDEPVIDVSIQILNELLQLAHDEEIDIVIVIIFKTLMKIIDNLCKYDQQTQNSATHNGAHQKQQRRKKFNARQIHCSSLQMQTQSLSCFFQGLFLNLLPNVSAELQEIAVRYLLRAGTCCCHYTLETVASFFNLVPKVSANSQKCIYKFIYRKILNALFVRAVQQPNSKRNSPNCPKCDAKLRSLEFHADLLQLYRQLYEKLHKDNEYTALILFLKHLIHISHLLTNDIASGVLAEIVLPIFRHCKAKSMEEKKSPVSANERRFFWSASLRTSRSDSTSHTVETDASEAFIRNERNVESNSRNLRSKSLNLPHLHINTSVKSASDFVESDHLKVLYECLNTFVIYLSDIRLIKAFYNEENIKHLEDLLSHPELIRGICDLIKIGIDNITFLGDNGQEQTALSRRLITLQLNSSDRAAQLFTAMLKRFSKSVRSVRGNFWLDDNEKGQPADTTQDSTHLKPLEILHIAALQWSLNYELLKTSQFFYNEFAKIYSIVVEDDDEGDDQQSDQVENANAYSKQERKDLPKSYLKHGDKTIIDILKLNYNALSSFLMVLRKKSPKSNPQTTNASHIFIFNTPIPTETADQTSTSSTSSNSNPIDKEVNCLSGSMETLLSSIDFATAQNSISSSCTSAAFARDTVESYEPGCGADCTYDRVTQFYVDTTNETFLQQRLLHSTQDELLTESIVLFDIRNQRSLQRQQVHQQNVLNSSTKAALSTVLADPNTQNDVCSQNSEGIISKLFGMFGSIFGGSRSNSLNDLNENKPYESGGAGGDGDHVIDDELQELCETNSDCKKLLLKLFEATMAICIKGYQNEEVEKMQKHLRKLKALILSSASANWQQHSEEHSRSQNTITQALQTLLKIAELSNTVNEPAAVVSNSILTSTDDAVVAASGSSTTGHGLRPSRPLTPPSSSAVYYPNLLTPPLPLIPKGIDAVSTPPTSATDRRPLSGESNLTEMDFFSTRASIICPDSEVEFSENEDFYRTADEGYEADGEIPEVSDTEAELEAVDLWNSFQPSSRYRNHVLHDGLCQLVVEILIELSQLCIQNPVGWCENLAQLANRLFVIREYLGGPLFLLRGFTPVLECNDVRLRELQQSLLELIVDLNTPNVLSTFFSILASKNPPVDILMKYMTHICASTLKKTQPTVELEFPVAIDGKCVSTSVPHISEQIDQVRNYHLHSQAMTPFTRAPCIIPITHTRLWTNDGFTLSLWVQVKSSLMHKSSSQLIDEDTRSSAEDYLKSHLVSIGSNQAMLSVYINSNMNLVFETCKPNAELKMTSPHCDDSYESSNQVSTSAANATSPNSVSKSKINNQTATSLGSQLANHSPFRNALKQTKIVLLNSFNHMHLFNGHADGADSYFEGSTVDLKYFRMAKNKWTHLCFAVDTLPDCLNLTIYIDGVNQHVISLPFRNLRTLTRTHAFQLISLGDGFSARPTNHTSSYTESRSTLDGYPIRLGFSNLILFNRKITVRESIMNLTAMGPDFSDLTLCQVGNWKPNYGYLNLSKLYSANFGNFTESMKFLKESRILSYSAQVPDVVFGSGSCADPETGSFGHQYGLILYGQLMQNNLQSLQTSTILCGGVSTLLYLFGRIVEVSNNSITQAMALDLLLSVSLSESQLYTEFQRNDCISLIGFVIKTERCTKDIQLLKSIVNNACSQPLIIKRGESLNINENTTASLVYPRLFISVLHRYSDWHRSGAEHSHVLDMLFRCILALTRDKHPHKEFNMEQLNKAGILKDMLNLCKVYVIESPNPVYISKDAAESFVSILSVFAGSPPSASLLDEIMKLLLLLHKPSECYITHDRSKFYFLLKSQPPPAKDKVLKSANFIRVTAPLRRQRPGVTAAVEPEIDANRAARISKLKKLHARNSPYKRAINELEENLENVADCSKLNKNALHHLSPVEATKWRLKFKRRSNVNLPGSPKKIALSKKLHKSPSDSFPQSQFTGQQKITRKRIRLHSANSSRSLLITENEKRCRRIERNSESSLQSLAASLATFDLDYGESGGSEGLNDVFTMPSTSQRRSKSLVKTDFYSSLGIIALQEGLFKLLKDFFCLLPDRAVEDVLRHYVKVEFLLVLANHSSCAVRTAIIKLLATLNKRLTSNDLQLFAKNFYPLHLGNQLSIYPTDVHMFEACLEWVTGLYGNLDSFANYDCIHVQNRFGLNALLGILTKTLLNQSEYPAKAFGIIKTIYLKDTDENQALVDCGLLQCCMKALYNIYTRTNVINSKTEEAVIELLTTIGERSLTSIGHMNIIWDIINMLSFYQDKESSNVVKGFRSVQSQLQLNWINIFFKQPIRNSSFKVVPLPNSSLTLSETKTRLDLLLDRCSQFFTVFDANYVPSENEIKLFELLVSYGISTNQRCNNFIAWGLQPSRPHALRAFIIDCLWKSCQDEFLPSIICDGKMIKSLLWLCLLEDLPQPIDNLAPLCQYLGINETDSTWNLENELGRIELYRCNTSAKQKSLLEKTVYKLESLAVNCIESSMVLTRRVAELQNAERKLLMSHMKEYDETYTYTKWLEIIRRMTHEGAPWYSKECADNSWELDDTEGPSRIHARLRRCHLDIDKRFIMEDYRMHGTNNSQKATTPTGITSLIASNNNDDYSRPLDYLISSYDQQLNISLNSQILYNFPAKYLPVDGEIDGEIIVTDHKLYFLATYHCKYFYVSCDISNITEIWLKRYQHQEKAFEIFLDTNQSLFFSLQNQEDWKIMKDVFCDKIVTHPDPSKILLVTQQWREGLLTNWEYLMTLNQIAGRTYNDLMQYPVFPWILANYTSEMLDLTDKNNFRKLEKPIAVQREENEQHYINNYTYINNTMTNMGSMILKPYHYSSHYSNSGTVLHFLVRVPPFTSYFLRYQDNNFDLPDRTFHALSTTWCLASRDSPTDVKELIPEFFCLPEMFENFERFNFGCRQSGERVEDVSLPPWCARDPRLFVLIHRQALESEMVRNNLHQWIDLIFGFKQTGESAVEAINVFHPATYSVFIESEIADPIERKAVETMVKTYGQMPRQLFKSPHPASKGLNYSAEDKEVMMSVRGLRWGIYAGSPQLPKPRLGNICKLPGAEYLVPFSNTNVIYGLPRKSCVMQGAESDIFNVISWGHEDRIVRIQPLNKSFSKPKDLLQNNPFDDITACGSDVNSNQLWFGHRSGRISVYKCSSIDALSRTAKSRQNYVRGLRLSYNSAFRKISTKSVLKMDADADGDATPSSLSTSSISSADGVQKDSADLCWNGPIVLVRHTDEITCISLSVEFKIAVSAGRDGIAVIWDLNNRSYVRTIERPAEIHHSPITQIAISPTLGDIVTVHTIPLHSGTNSESHLRGSSTNDEISESRVHATSSADECFEVTEENLDDFVNVSVNPNGKSILRLHSVNARYIHHNVNEERITAVCYSYIKEGVGVNVIATALEGGLVRLWSSWNLHFVTDIVTGISNIKSLTYSTHQHLVVLTEESKIQVWETDGLYGNSPKFPQIAYK